MNQIRRSCFLKIHEFIVNANARLFETFLAASLISFFFSFAACEDDGANAIGLDGIDTGQLAGNVQTDTLYVEDLMRDTSFMDSVSTGSADRLYLGTIDNYDFRIAMKFFMPIDIESVTVKSAKLELISAASYGPPGTFTANVRAINKNWTQEDLRWNRLTGAGDIGDIIAQATITNTPASGTLITINMPRDTIQHWVWAINDTNRAKINRGVIIEFSGTGFVQQFYGANNLTLLGDPDTNVVPRLDITYEKYDPIEQILDPGHIHIVPVQLTNGRYSQGYSGYIFRDQSTPQQPNALTVGGGVPYHALMQFSASKIPANATINLATLVMKLDPAGNYLYSSGDSLLLQALRVESSDWQSGVLTTHNLDEAYINSISRYRNRLTDNLRDDSLTFNITRQFQDWSTFPLQNFGIRISHADEVIGNFRKIYRVRFVNNPLDRENSPKIIVHYTTVLPEN